MKSREAGGREARSEEQGERRKAKGERRKEKGERGVGYCGQGSRYGLTATILPSFQI